jgi:hypothetical protein
MGVSEEKKRDVCSGVEEAGVVVWWVSCVGCGDVWEL